jgi:hypothetical protein
MGKDIKASLLYMGTSLSMAAPYSQRAQKVEFKLETETLPLTAAA